VVRVWMIRVAWLPPVLMLKRANIRIMCSGEGELMGWSDKSPFGKCSDTGGGHCEGSVVNTSHDACESEACS
jgi:hypothetical protein